MQCCYGRETPAAFLNEDSKFDLQIKNGFAKIKEEGNILRSDPAKIEYRFFDDGMALAWSEDHFSQKRKASKFKQVCTPADEEAFNFTKVTEAEIIGEVEWPDRENEAHIHSDIIANVSPCADAHVLIVPQRDLLHPQYMTQDLLLAGLHILSLSTKKDFRLVFNSLCAFATVNHFHYHAVYLRNLGFKDDMSPMEQRAVIRVAGDQWEGNVSVELVVESHWPVRCFVFSAGCKQGEEGPTPAGDIHALADATMRFISHLQKKNIPHNIVLAPATPWIQKSSVWHTLERASNPKPDSISPMVRVIPRRSEEDLRDDAGFNAAILEMCGMVYCHSKEKFDNFQHDEVFTIFKEDVCYPSTDIDELICKAAWLTG